MTFVFCEAPFLLPAFLEQTESWQIKWIGLVVVCDYMMNGKVFSPVYEKETGSNPEWGVYSISRAQKVPGPCLGDH